MGAEERISFQKVHQGEDLGESWFGCEIEFRKQI
jgi:hypothetical protein